jgi:hypothetical protein
VRFPSFIIPEEINIANRYSQTFSLLHQGRLSEAYSELYRYRSQEYYNMNYKERLIHYFRPYYLFSDEDRYLWFNYLQAELRSSGLNDFADSILETEIKHYKELIVWQLQLRAYLTQKLYEYGDYLNLSTLSDLLAKEYTELKNDSLFRTSFEKALEVLHRIDDKVQTTSSIDITKGIIALPWIDREAIDNKQGIVSKVLIISPDQISWKIAEESITDEVKEEMKNSYNRSIHYIRVLAIMSEHLFIERDLKTMVVLHSNLVHNKNVNLTPAGISYKDFSVLKETYGDGENFPELDPQTRLDIRRYDLLANDFWGHQWRRKNGDMTAGDIILPWVEVP